MSDRKTGDMILGELAPGAAAVPPEQMIPADGGETKIRTWENMACPHCGVHMAAGVFAPMNNPNWTLMLTATHDELVQAIESLPGVRRGP